MATELGGYRFMWLICMFDLPVGTPGERRLATKFRQFLLDEAFEMSQFSVYLRFCAGKDKAEAHVRRIKAALPPSGHVHIFMITDRQYELSWSFRGQKRERRSGIPNQLALF